MPGKRSPPSCSSRSADTKIHLQDDDESPLRPTFVVEPDRNVDHMKRTLWLTILAFAVLLLALGGWAVNGVRWTLSGPRRARSRPATA